MHWWGWVAGGVIMLGAELMFVDAQFYLVFIGGAALLVGALVALGLVIEPGLEWMLFSVIAVASLLGLRKRIYQRLRGGLPAIDVGGVVGQTVHVPVDLATGEQCRLEFRGTTWDAINADTGPLSAGTSAHIDRVEGLILYLRKS